MRAGFKKKKDPPTHPKHAIRLLKPSHCIAPTSATVPASIPALAPPYDNPSSKAYRYDTGPPVSSTFEGKLRWKKTWTVPAGIVGFYLLALAIAIAHLCFFDYLDNRFIVDGVAIPEKSTSIPQAYATTISLLLTTAFRAALVASTAICYTQHLWAILRQQALKISLIESLFQIQTNAYHFSNAQLTFKTPTLALVASFCWLIPLATVYPPGALIVGLESSVVNTRFNVSTFHRTSLADNYSSLTEFYHTGIRSYTHNLRPNLTEDEKHFLQSTFSDSSDIKYIARSVFLSGEIMNLAQPSGHNSSYNLEFWGTTIDCKSENRTVYRALDKRDYGVIPHGITVHNLFTVHRLNYVFSEEGPFLANHTFSYQEDGRPNYGEYEYNVAKKHRYFPCYDLEDLRSTFLQDPEGSIIDAPEINIIEPLVTTVCTPKTVRYYVTIAHAGGNQNVSYRIKDEEATPENIAYFLGFQGDLEQWTQFTDAFTMYNAFASMLSLNSSTDSTLKFTDMVTPSGLYTLPNGTVVETCELKAGGTTFTNKGYPEVMKDSTRVDRDLWDSSIFGRRNPTGNKYRIKFDPELMNDVLVKTTISALSLNERFDMVDGTETRAFNIYRFQRKLPFFLPYALSLGLAIPVIALGLSSLYIKNNGVSAIPGGFIQVLMTTTGRTSLEDVIGKGSRSMGGTENVSRELSEMKIRFGELIEEDGGSSTEALPAQAHQQAQKDQARRYDMGIEDTNQEKSAGYTNIATVVEACEEGPILRRRAGFGTVDETRPFSKET